MANHDCPDCNCPRDWHSRFTGHCYGCNKDCPSQKTEDAQALPFEFAQDHKFKEPQCL
jgi:hypothetical protein